MFLFFHEKINRTKKNKREYRIMKKYLTNEYEEKKKCLEREQICLSVCLSVYCYLHPKEKKNCKEMYPKPKQMHACIIYPCLLKT